MRENSHCSGVDVFLYDLCDVSLAGSATRELLQTSASYSSSYASATASTSRETDSVVRFQRGPSRIDALLPILRRA